MKTVNVKGILVFVVLVLLMSCSSNSPEKLSGYVVYYADNGGDCLPCNQIRQFAKKISSIVDEQYDVKYENLKMELDDNSKLIEKCSLFPRDILVAQYKNGKVKEFKKIGTERIVIEYKEPGPVIDDLADSVKLFIEGTL